MAERDETSATFGMIDRGMAAADRAWLAKLSQDPLLTPGMRANLASSVEWLAAHDGRSLAPAYRKRFLRYEIALAKALKNVADGLPPWGTEEEQAARAASFRSRPAPWKSSPRPSWQADPSHLPKAPPGKRGAA